MVGLETCNFLGHNGQCRDMTMSDFYTSDMIPLNLCMHESDPAYRIATKLYTVHVMVCRSRLKYKKAVELKREAQYKREQAATVVQTCWRGYRCVQDNGCHATSCIRYTCLICRAKQLFHQLKRDKLEQQLQRDAELKREQAATSVQALWRGYRWVWYTSQLYMSCKHELFVHAHTFKIAGQGCCSKN